MRLFALSLAIGGLVPLAVLADDPPPPPEGVWTGKGQAGYLSSQGNSQAKSANAMLDLALVDGPWKHTVHIGGLYGESAGILAAERYDAEGQSSYDITQRLFAFGGLRYQHDMFDGFQYQASGTGGFGYKFFDSDATKLTVQVGAGYRRLRPEIIDKDGSGAVVSRVPEEAIGEAIGTLGVNYSQKLTGTTTLTDKLLVESGSSDTLVTNALALAVKISTKLALSVGYSIQDNNQPPAPLKKLDTLETLNLVYSF